jgi:hypothetical protein
LSSRWLAACWSPCMGEPRRSRQPAVHNVHRDGVRAAEPEAQANRLHGRPRGDGTAAQPPPGSPGSTKGGGAGAFRALIDAHFEGASARGAQSGVGSMGGPLGWPASSPTPPVLDQPSVLHTPSVCQRAGRSNTRRTRRDWDLCALRVDGPGLNPGPR